MKTVNASVADIAYALRSLEILATAIVKGFETDPGHSDLDNEQPINVSMTLGDYRKARNVLHALKAKP